MFQSRSDGWRYEVKEKETIFDAKVFVLSHWKDGPFTD